MGLAPPTARRVFVDDDPADQDIFDCLWRHDPRRVATIDWLADKGQDAWIAAVEALAGAHAEDVYRWMVDQPQCARPVAAAIFWWCEPAHYAERLLRNDPPPPHDDVYALAQRILERWGNGDFADSPMGSAQVSDALGYAAVLARHPGAPDPLAIPPDLLQGADGRPPEPVSPATDMDFWYVVLDWGPGIPRGAGEAEWRAFQREDALARDRALQHRAHIEAERARPASPLERLFYGGRFTGAKAQIDRCWTQFNAVMAVLALGLLAITRLDLPLIVGFGYVLAAIGIMVVYQVEGRMGGMRRLGPWYGVAIALVMTSAIVLRRLDSGPL